MVDTNILVSAALFRNGSISEILKEIMSRYDLCICTFSLEELFIVFRRKFNHKMNDLDEFLRELSYELVYSPLKIVKAGLPLIRDEDDYPVLVSAIDADIDVLVSGDKDFSCVDCERPEILSPMRFKEQYL
ncbi:MAG: putative toxin-antitoxin system toxin component, PIN family [Synergistaceae bacterium]|jgi:putative PIN family toxin of toxin-antitoxin system|nr:putative toxin-antitoxin system toxin component, PIN family [Synergistaceae bacterium]